MVRQSWLGALVVAAMLPISSVGACQERSPQYEVADSDSDEPPEEPSPEWEPGQPIPLGYHARRKHTLAIVGGATLGGGYVISATMGLAMMAQCNSPMFGGGDNDTCTKSMSDASSAWLLVPLAGPFIALTRSDVQKDDGAKFWFPIFGVIQVAGLGLIAYDWIAPTYRLERTESAHWNVLPLLTREVKGIAATAQF